MVINLSGREGNWGINYSARLKRALTKPALWLQE